MTGLIHLADLVARYPRWAPYSGWHDDHRAADGTPAYLPAIQQVRGEFAALLDALEVELPSQRAVLQLGMGACDASHLVWRVMFDRAVTLDYRITMLNDQVQAGVDTHDPLARAYAALHGPYDLIFIDAGHGYVDVEADFHDYGPLTAAGGLVVFHDALPRRAYPEVEVHHFLRTLPSAQTIGTEVGIAWLRP